MSHNTNDAGDSVSTGQTVGADSKLTTVQHDWTQVAQPSVMVVEAVSAATDRTTTDLPPLQQSIDADALDTVLTHGESSVTVAFTYAGVAVSASGNGTVEVRIDGYPTEREDDS